MNAAFTYTRAHGNRFNCGERGAWYCAWDALTSVAEVGLHRTRELGFIGRFKLKVQYVEFLADFIGDFPDLCADRANTALDADLDQGYPAGQALAADLRRAGHRGLIYPSVRRKSGRCFVGFDPGGVQNVRPGASWMLEWNGGPEFSVIGL